jgi:ABC-type nitrate/sulfonate/bicarbonate transport system permease component
VRHGRGKPESEEPTMTAQNVGIGLFLVVGTGLIMAVFVGLAIWLERSFKK